MQRCLGQVGQVTANRHVDMHIVVAVHSRDTSMSIGKCQSFI